MTLEVQYRSGEKAPFQADFRFVQYADGSDQPRPKEWEQRIEIKGGEMFPIINSTQKEAIWVMTSTT